MPVLLLLALLSSPALAGGRPPAADATVAVYHDLAARQCADGGTPLPQLARRLAQAGVRVVASSCGHDGLLRPAMCGAPDGRIGIFDIPANQAAAAARAGFAALATLPDARRQACSPS